MQQLVAAHAEDVDHLAVEARERSASVSLYQEVDGRAPTLGSGQDLGGQRTIAIIGQDAARRCQRLREIVRAGVQAPKSFVGSDP
jgi:hypothetical protein